MVHTITMESMGLSGGLALFWNDTIQENEGIIQKRLDRVLVSPNWKIKFENVNVQHIEIEASDHSALMLSSDAEPIRKKKWFYFDKRWIEREEVQNIISKAWSYDCNGFEQSRVSFKIKHCRRSLVAWLRGGSNDRLIWHHTKTGNYEVKSGYYIAKDLIDAGLQNDDGRVSIGIAALDSLGNLLHAHGSPIQFVGKVMTAEAIVIRKALEYAINKGWKRVKILSDAKNVVDMIQKRVTTSWEIEVLCEDIWKISSMFNHVEFIYISRSVNKIADKLARYSISLLKEISWKKFFPSWIIQDAKDMFKLCIPSMQ
ncbi:hypothetical protein KY285_037582 [Solanum tuberosum]|nr:hypothetical protein KY285_037582 [Solanum tuberosum]